MTQAIINTLPSTYLSRVASVASIVEAKAAQWVDALPSVEDSAYITAVKELDKLITCLAHPFNDN